MFKKIFLSLLAILSLSQPIGLSQEAPLFNQIERDPLDNMPILEKNKFGVVNPPPIARRGQEYRKFLSASVKIAVGDSSGSGTIVHYDPEKNLAYVATCGHLWPEGIMTVEQGKKLNRKCRIIVWYQNDQKLDAPKYYNANVVFYSFLTGQDTGLVTFTPDWIPNVFPIGAKNYEYIKGQYAHSCGCDSGSEVAHYDVEFVMLQKFTIEGTNIETLDLVTEKNSPRPGRSGGGLMNDEGFYIGTCWGTQYRDGTGKGYFTPLSVIHRFWAKQNGYAFLLEQKSSSGSAQLLKIIDHSNSGLKFAAEYIILPVK
jgi:hypothetical protein